MANDDIGDGRKPPPIRHRFLKGKSGNPAGRPKGAVSTKKLTAKVALSKRSVVIDGKTVRVTVLELVLMKLKALAVEGNPGAIELFTSLASLPTAEEASEGFGHLLVPEMLTVEEAIAQMEEHNAAHPDEPGTKVDVHTEEFLKAVRGEPSPLGEAIRAYHEKWR